MALFRERHLPGRAAAMAECERRLEALAARPGGLLGRSCSGTLAAGGKRLRPLLVFLSARHGAPPDEKVFAAAVAVELVHMATLVHDDVLDRAELRRGRPTLYARHGAGVSAAAGDYLFATAFRVLAAAGSRPAA
ncbi:MAG: polyprenyl synthetase family protein, partial [Gaiellales bacterium]